MEEDCGGEHGDAKEEEAGADEAGGFAGWSVGVDEGEREDGGCAATREARWRGVASRCRGSEAEGRAWSRVCDGDAGEVEGRAVVDCGVEDVQAEGADQCAVEDERAGEESGSVMDQRAGFDMAAPGAATDQVDPGWSRWAPGCGRVLAAA